MHTIQRGFTINKFNIDSPIPLNPSFVPAYRYVKIANSIIDTRADIAKYFRNSFDLNQNFVCIKLTIVAKDNEINIIISHFGLLELILLSMDWMDEWIG